MAVAQKRKCRVCKEANATHHTFCQTCWETILRTYRELWNDVVMTEQEFRDLALSFFVGWEGEHMDTIQKQTGVVKRGDWVTCSGPSLVGVVKRIAGDGSWADVNWHTHTKRMQTKVLEVQTTIDVSNDWQITDMTRAKDISAEKGKAHLASSEPLVYNLGAHILMTQDDHALTIEDCAIVIHLDGDEAYKLLLVLQALFT